MEIIQKMLERWIDNEEKLEHKYIEKMFIMIYFSKTHPMYTDHKITIDWKKIKKIERLAKKILEVKEWKDYKYVNDFQKKDSVKMFLGSCYSEVEKLKKLK